MFYKFDRFLMLRRNIKETHAIATDISAANKLITYCLKYTNYDVTSTVATLLFFMHFFILKIDNILDSGISVRFAFEENQEKKYIFYYEILLYQLLLLLHTTDPDIKLIIHFEKGCGYRLRSCNNVDFKSYINEVLYHELSDAYHDAYYIYSR